MPRCDFRLAWAKGINLTFPQFSPLRHCSYLLSLETSILAHQGRADDALGACRAKFRLCSAADEPILIGQLVRYAVVAISCRSLNTVVRDSQPSPSACRSLAKDIARLDIATRYIDTLKGERAFGIAVFEQVRASPDPTKAFLELAGEPGDNQPSPGASRKTPFTRWWLASDELTYLQLMGQVIAEASLPYRRVLRVHPSVEERLGSTAIRWPPRGILTVILLPTLTNASMARDRAIAQLGLAETALFLKAYRAERGTYPESLARLQGINGRPLPMDPFSGKPFVYRRAGEGFLIYSWGPNLKDDRGMSPPKDQRDEGDIIIRCVR
jgi:hypothetical protein